MGSIHESKHYQTNISLEFEGLVCLLLAMVFLWIIAHKYDGFQSHIYVDYYNGINIEMNLSIKTRLQSWQTLTRFSRMKLLLNLSLTASILDTKTRENK